jgi:acyl-CoA synthetase (AMP-forming)/AMP-acid ligase II
MGPHEWFSDIPGSDPLSAVGRVMPFAGLEVRDADNRRAGPDEVGEIAIRNNGQAHAIWNDPQLTADRMIDGWILTGDIGKLDRNGFLYLVDRKDDMIISGGLNIWPTELERVISALPGVREVAVFGIPDDHWGESPAAVVVLHEGATLTDGEVIEHVPNASVAIWKSRSRGGRPQIDVELRTLIRWMSIENLLWGAPRIHGELLKLGFKPEARSTSTARPLRTMSASYEEDPQRPRP